MTTNAKPLRPALPAAAPAPQAALWLGLLLAMGGAMLLGSKGILAKLLYAEGVDVTTLVTLRSAAALPAFRAFTGAAKQSKGKKVAARQPGTVLKPIEDAPGSYVKVRFDQRCDAPRDTGRIRVGCQGGCDTGGWCR